MIKDVTVNEKNSKKKNFKFFSVRKKPNGSVFEQFLSTINLETHIAFCRILWLIGGISAYLKEEIPSCKVY
jgi:hypothetical protein